MIIPAVLCTTMKNEHLDCLFLLKNIQLKVHTTRNFTTGPVDPEIRAAQISQYPRKGRKTKCEIKNIWFEI